ncbi:MAG: DUF3467 domain-containing protein [Desulfomonile tiedjei]|nr:DUF3467 domain-containing protein [Desulfomonile tiedjei]
MADSTTDKEQEARPQQPGAPARAMAKQMGIYYSNCAMVATSPRDISLFFGRYVPGSNEKGEQAMVELYEHQIYMTLEQAEDLVRILGQTVQVTKARRKEAGNIG